jgi:hypothetical protein
MTRPKVRTFIAALAAAVAVAAVLAPVASAGLVPTTGPTETVVTQGPTGSTDTIARVNDGRFKTSLEAKKIKAANCANMRTMYDAAMDDAAYWQYRKASAQSAEAWAYYNSKYNDAIDDAAQSWSTLVAWGCV